MVVLGPSGPKSKRWVTVDSHRNNIRILAHCRHRSALLHVGRRRSAITRGVKGAATGQVLATQGAQSRSLVLGIAVAIITLVGPASGRWPVRPAHKGLHGGQVGLC